MNTAIAIGIGAAVALAAAQLYMLGDRGGIGPLGFLHERRMARLLGNGARYSFERIVPEKISPLQGKHILVLGSSVVYGAASQQSSVAEYLAGRLGCTYQKEAVSGTTLCGKGEKTYVSRLKKLDRSVRFDLAICQLSTNDARQRKPIGEIGDDDIDTVTGALEYIASYIKATWNCPVIFFTGSRYANHAYAAMVQRLLELKKARDIGVIDLWSDDGFNALSDADRALYMADGVHPTKAGYRDWWGPEMERQILKIISGYERMNTKPVYSKEETACRK